VKREIEARTVGEVMSGEPVTVTPKTNLKTVKRLFEERGFNVLPVVDGKGHIIGVVTKMDLLRLFRPDQRSWVPDFSHMDANCVEDILGDSFSVVHPDDPITVAVDRMIELNARALPVVERDTKPPRLVGIVSRKDVLKSLRFLE